MTGMKLKAILLSVFVLLISLSAFSSNIDNYVEKKDAVSPDYLNEMTFLQTSQYKWAKSVIVRIVDGAPSAAYAYDLRISELYGSQIYQKRISVGSERYLEVPLPLTYPILKLEFSNAEGRANIIIQQVNYTRVYNMQGNGTPNVYFETGALDSGSPQIYVNFSF